MQLNGFRVMVQRIQGVGLGAQAPGQGGSVCQNVCHLECGIGQPIRPMGIDPDLLPDSLCEDAYDFIPCHMRMLRDQVPTAGDVIEGEQLLDERIGILLARRLNAHQKPFFSRFFRKRARHRLRINPIDPVAKPNSLATSS